MRDNLEKLNALEQDFGGEVAEIRSAVDGFHAAEAKMREKDRNLSISIVGRVKSGKSSFLNALLFKGESVLPQAATPMTAALTYIRYAPKCRAEVEFFTKKEWETFLEQSKKYDEILAQVRAKLVQEEEAAKKKAKLTFRTYKPREITDELVAQRAQSESLLNENYAAAHELVTMSKRGLIDVEKLLGTVHKTDEYEKPTDLVGVLGDYVGSNGRYTPIVCSTTIYLNDKNLDGYEIVDTPGTNDPVISRGLKTEKSLASTDVVLAVSPAGRFFDSGDLALLAQNLPASGVKDFMIVASQYDLAVGNIENKIDRSLSPQERLVTAMATVQQQLADSYHTRISEIARQSKEKDTSDTEKWQRLTDATPQCVSAQAYILSQRWDRLTAKEKEQLEVFNTRIPGFTFDREMLSEFSMLDQVQEKVASVKAKKAEITERRGRELAAAFDQKLKGLVANLRTRVEQRIAKLQETDVAQLEKELKTQTATLEKGRARLENVFLEAIQGAHLHFNEILAGIRAAKSEYSRLDVNTESHTEIEDHGCGFLFWRSLTGNRYESYTVETSYASSYAVAQQIDAFADRAKTSLERGLASAVDIRKVQNAIVDATLELFENGADEGFDAMLLKTQIENAVRKITIPDADFGDIDYTKMISDSFSGDRVEDAAIDVLRKAQHEALHAVVADLEKQAKAKAKSIEKGLNDAMATFVDKLIADLKQENEALAANLHDKESVLKRIRGYLSFVDNL